MVSTYASEIMEEDLRRDHTYREDYTQRLRDSANWTTEEWNRRMRDGA